MRYLKIKSLPSSSKEWLDRDIIMLHACFQILEDCVEKEGLDTHMNYDAHKDIVDEIRFLYEWWKKRKNEDDVEFDDIEQMEIDDEMLIRLIKIRGHLWT